MLTLEQKAALADALVELLFPPPVKQADGWWLDSGVDDISGAIIDMERAEGHADEVCMGTLKRVEAKLMEARQLVGEALGDRMQESTT